MEEKEFGKLSSQQFKRLADRVKRNNEEIFALNKDINENPEKVLDFINDDAQWSIFYEFPFSHFLALFFLSLDLGEKIKEFSSSVDPQEAVISWAESDPIPLNADAIAVLRRQLGKSDTYVFTYKGKPVTKANNHAWRKALKRAGIENFRWHDLRHTWASWHIQMGTPLNVLQELGAWASPEMVQRYAHLSSDHLAEFANKLEGPVPFSTKLAQLDSGIKRVVV